MYMYISPQIINFPFPILPSDHFADCYIWKLPQYSERDIDAICCGFIKQYIGYQPENIDKSILNSCKDSFYKLDIMDEEIINTNPGDSVTPIYWKTNMNIDADDFDANTLNFATFFLSKRTYRENEGSMIGCYNYYHYQPQ